MGLKTVYVQLLDEGTPTYRPTTAEELKEGIFRLQSIPEYNSEDELWEFPPGSIVRCEERLLNTMGGGGTVELVAVAEDSPMK